MNTSSLKLCSICHSIRVRNGEKLSDPPYGCAIPKNHTKTSVC